jgi:3',5'-cyclic-AMP phosphodiesterase
MLVAHLSDPHITAGALAAEPAAGLDWALQRVRALKPRPDCVVVTGDLTDHGRPEEYQVLRELIEDFPLPLHLGLGNHDDRAAALQALGGTRFLAGGHSSRYVVDYPDASLVMLDSLAPGREGGGHLDADQLNWLRGTLDERPGPALVSLHHPPIPVGIAVLDQIRLDNPDDLAGILTGRQPRPLVLCGHVHRHITGSLAETPVVVAPSTYRQFELTLHPDETAGYVREPAGFLLHLLNPEHSWVTHTVPTHATSATYAAV